MATQKVNGKISEICKMSVAGGDLKLPKGMKYYTNLRLDFSGMTEEELIGLASEGSSVRVKAQAKLRAMGDGELAKKSIMAESAQDVKEEDLGWFEFNVATDFEADKTQNPAKRAASAFKKMDDEAKVKFIAETLGITEDEARAQLGKQAS